MTLDCRPTHKKPSLLGRLSLAGISQLAPCPQVELVLPRWPQRCVAMLHHPHATAPKWTFMANGPHHAHEWPWPCWSVKIPTEPRPRCDTVLVNTTVLGYSFCCSAVVPSAHPHLRLRRTPELPYPWWSPHFSYRNDSTDEKLPFLASVQRWVWASCPNCDPSSSRSDKLLYLYKYIQMYTHLHTSTHFY